tara:strand:- start:1276 stop:1989 length:714 start_codon:yes stop_codon:yes gene_type:complete
MSSYRIDCSPEKNTLASRAVQVILENIQTALKKKKRVQIALSGGSTPSVVYKLLSQENISWQRVDVFLGDERWVDSNDPLSNSLMIRNTLLSSSPGSLSSFHSIPTTQLSNPEESADAFEKLLREKCFGAPPIFDLMLLGLGEDGHTASLFPSTKSLNVIDRWTTVSRGKGQDRITLTAPVLSAASKVIFLVSGSSKQIALKRLIDPAESTERTPAKLVQPAKEILVLVDQAAANLI